MKNCPPASVLIVLTILGCGSSGGGSGASSSNPASSMAPSNPKPIPTPIPLPNPHPSLTARFVSLTGSDASGDGRQNQPWRTITFGVSQLQMGEELLVEGGTYRESVDINRGGTPTWLLTIRAVNNGTVILNPPVGLNSPEGFDIQRGLGFIRIQGFRIEDGFDESIHLRTGSHDILIEDCDVLRNKLGAYIVDAKNATFRRVKFLDNVSAFAAGVDIVGVSDTILFEDCESSGHDDGRGSSGDADGFQVGRDAKNITFRHCTAKNNSEDGFDSKAENTVIERCTAIGNFIGIKARYTNARVENCLVAKNTDLGLSAGGGTLLGPIIIQFCTIVENGAQGLQSDSSWGGGNFDLDVNHCVFAFNGSRAIDVTTSVRLISDFNIWYRSSNAGPLLTQRGGPQTDYTMTQGNLWVQNTGLDQNSFFADPLVLDRVNGQYELSAISPAQNQGSSLNSVLIDINGQIRANPADLGAYEN